MQEEDTVEVRLCSDVRQINLNVEHHRLIIRYSFDHLYFFEIVERLHLVNSLYQHSDF